MPLNSPKRKNLIIALPLLLINSVIFAADPPVLIPEVNLNPTPLKMKKIYEKPEITHIDRKKIATSPVTDLTRLLKQEQSIVRLTNNSGDYSQIAFSIRGFGDNAVANSLILVDGFPLINPSLLAPNFNSIVLSDIERIDITQGSEGVLWGDQAVGGTVNIITRHPEKLILETNIGFGSFNNKFYSIFAGDKFKNGIFLKAFGYSNKTDNYRNHNQQNNENLAIQGGMDYSTGRLSLYIQKYENLIHFPGGLTKEQYDTDPKQATNFKNFIHFNTQLFQLINKQELNENWILETRFSPRKTEGDGFMFSSFTREDSINTISSRLIGNINQFKILGGYEGLYTHYDFKNSRVEENAKTQQYNLFSRVIAPIKNIELIFGARGAMQNNTFSPGENQQTKSLNKTLVTEQGFAFPVGEYWMFSLKRSGNFRFPKANEETWLPQGVSALKLQTGISYEIGGERKTAQQRTKINVYQLKLHDEIAFNPTQTPSEPFGSYSNFPETIRQGVTISEDYFLTPTWMINSQLNYVNAYFSAGEFSGNSIPAVPNVNGNIGLTYEFISYWRVKYSALYTGSTYASQDDENVGKKIPGYWLNTIAFQYIKKPVNIGFEVSNLFNQTYSIYTLYDPDTQTNSYYPGTGRSFLLTAKVDIN